MRRVHFVLTGQGQQAHHLAGVSKLGADEIVLFARQLNGNLVRLRETVESMGVEYRVSELTGGYIDAFVKASEETIASLTDDCALAINMSTNQCVELSAIEDAVRIQLYFFHQRNNKAVCSAFRYYVRIALPLRVDIAPFWNFPNGIHNDIFEILSNASESVGTVRLWHLIQSTRDSAIGYEAFRKIFRDFKRWLKNTPCFSENMGRSPEYKIDLK